MAVTQSAPALVASKPSASKYDPQQDFVEEVVIPFDDEDPADSSDYSYDENIPAPESEPKLEPAAEVNEPFDLSDALAQTSIQLKATRLE